MFCAKTFSVKLSTRWRRVYCFLLGVQRFQGELQDQQVNSVLTVCVCVVSRVSSLSVSVRRPACPHCLCLCTEVPGRAAGPAGERGAHQAARSGDPPRLSPQRRPLRQVLPHHHPDALGAGTTPHAEKILIL